MSGGFGFPEGFSDWDRDRRAAWRLDHPDFFSPVDLDDDWDVRPAANGNGKTHASGDDGPDGELPHNYGDPPPRGERAYRQEEPPEPPPPFEEQSASPPPDRESLLLAAWLQRDIPLRDYLLGGVMCTTSRWFIHGATGVGKTLLGMDLGAAIAGGAAFLKWTGQRKARVMYLDGELPMETFKERLELLAKRYGADIDFYGYNREDLGDDGLPPLNTEAGQAWLRREIEAINPDIIIFDSIMCLLSGSMLDEATWMPMRPFVRWLTSRRIAQVWLHHSNDSGKSFGDKTREWEMDTIAFLSHPIGEDGEPDDTAIQWEFHKARLRTPANAEQFKPFIIRLGEDWEIENAAKAGKKTGVRPGLSVQYLQAYDRLADGATPSHGLDFKPVRKVSADAIRDELKSRGFLELNDNRTIANRARKALSDAKTALLARTALVEADGMVWRP
ncbi:AAA family ATPase [Methylocella sp.]|jgi:hypothetical protein|uniref:AAA family ATPase n=1 Tax=Methylocella sp. TaxID=1978226 RepID=UPI003C27833D